MRDRQCILDFLRLLRDNNDRLWFEENRSQYEEARAAYEGVVEELIARFGSVDDIGGVTARECMFRINRDLRFSKDKSPYKVAMGALIGRRGRKSGARSYYFHVEPDGRSFLAGGLYDPTADQLGRMRHALAAGAKPLKQILKAPTFVRYFGGLAGDSLKTAPQGYPKDHPEIELLRRKQFLVTHPLGDDMVVSHVLVPHALRVFKAMKPFLLYIEDVLGEG
jgi:uncharacterized protein (TIGR02453 family)